MQMKHEYDQNVHVHFGQQVHAGSREKFLFIVSSAVIKKIIHKYLAQGLVVMYSTFSRRKCLSMSSLRLSAS